MDNPSVRGWCTSIALGTAAAIGAGCGPTALRMGPAIVLPSGLPRTPCEQERWLELAPARGKATGTESYGRFAISTTVQAPGYGVFSPGKDEALKLEDVWPRLGQPDLRDRHDEPIRREEAKERTALYWALGGLAAMGGGVAFAASGGDHPDTAHTVVGVTGVGLGLVAAIVALVVMPSGQEQAEAEIRRYMFLPDQDDMGAATRAVDLANVGAQTQCTGR
jgi:hypothetical protein